MVAEAGGPAVQAGIFYQNTIAALYLGRMLDLRSRAVRDRVVRVRVEAPEAVDDLVVEMGDGSKIYIQVKLDIRPGSDAWTALWRNFALQLRRESFGSDDHLRLVLGTPSLLAEALHDAAKCAIAAEDTGEWQGRLSKPQKRAVRLIAEALGDVEEGYPSVWRLLQHTGVEVKPAGTVERDYAPLWMPESNQEAGHLLAVVRDLVSGASQIRGSFDAQALRAQLREAHGIEIGEPEGWGAAAYRGTIIRGATVEVPGTGQAQPIAEAFLWPRASRYDRSRPTDFDDETPQRVVGVRVDEVDLRAFGSPGLERLVVVAGPGFGKSLLTVALSRQAAVAGMLPVIVPIPDLSRLDLEITEFLTEEVNRRYEVRIDWQMAAESGLLVLFLDGLDEVATARRAVVLERIKRFSVRFPRVAWMLTVRDAAALAAPTDATLVELEPLSEEEVGRFIELALRGDVLRAERIRRRIDATPDLKRLTRIPLFLALLIATIERGRELPRGRADLLEAYLDLLFRPEQFKGGAGPEPDPFMLRGIVEAVAFQALEREEIGFDVRLILGVVRERIGRDTPVEPLIERLVRCGVVRRVGPRLEFPFPIVQEYLAACEILAHRMDELPDRLASAIKRPWAQTLQFVLERHPAPEALTAERLDAPDDAFNTQLRLLARSVANGMRTTDAFRAEIARRLVAIWPKASWRSVDRIGELLADAFTNPLVPELRRLLGKGWAMHHGGGAIVTRIADPTLTRAVLGESLATKVELNLGGLQEAVDALGNEALCIYTARSRSPRTTEDEQDALAALIGHLDGSAVSAEERLAAALDEDLAVPVRLAAFGLTGGPPDARAVPLIEKMLMSENRFRHSLAMDHLSMIPDPEVFLRNFLHREDLSLEHRMQVADTLPRAIECGVPVAVLVALARDPLLETDLRDRLLVFAARFGDTTAMESIVTTLGERPYTIASAAISLFGHHRSRALAATAADALHTRLLTPSERVDLAGRIVLGMTGIYEMMDFTWGGIKPGPLHPGADLLRSVVEEWAEADDYDLVEALRLDAYLVRLGSGSALGRLPSRIAAVFAARALDLHNDNQASTFANAIRALHENHQLLSVEFLEQMIAESSWNVAHSAAPMLAAHGSREAFDALVRLYEKAPGGSTGAYLLELLEPLAGRLGLRVWSVAGQLDVRSE